MTNIYVVKTFRMVLYLVYLQRNIANPACKMCLQCKSIYVSCLIQEKKNTFWNSLID